MLIAAAALMLAVLVVAVPAAGAQHPFKRHPLKKARFNVTVNGTFTGTGKSTETECHYLDDDLNNHIFTLNTAVQDRAVFSSRSRGIVELSSVGGGPVGGGMVKKIPAQATLNRSRTSDPARPCTEPGHPDVCGQKSLRFNLAVVGHPTRRSALRYAFQGRSGIVNLDDPFGSDCRLVTGQRFWGGVKAIPIAVSKARIFNKRVKRIVVNGGHKKTVRDSGEGYSDESSYVLSWTITLKRRKPERP